MSLWEALLLGVIQGTTEFLPVSSSGHLALAKHFLHVRPSLAFDAALHAGTLVVVLGYYRADLLKMLVGLVHSGRDLLGGRRLTDIWREDHATRLALLIGLGSVPTALLGLGLKSHVERALSSGLATSVALVITGGILLATRWRRSAAPEDPAQIEGPAPWAPTGITVGLALLVGIAQGLAVFPGISRSGATLAVALLAGAGRADAARYCFLLSVPAILGALLLESGELAALGQQGFLPVSLGVVTALVTGYLSLAFLVALVRRGNLHRFTWYVLPLGVAGVVYFALHG